MQSKYNYYTQTEFENFLIVPKILFTDTELSKLSYGAKLLYSLLLDRMSLSVKNGWVDNFGNTYIYYTIESVMETLGVSRKKANSIFAELDNERGCGLIVKVKQGLGKPARIYVMDCKSPRKCGKP